MPKITVRVVSLEEAHNSNAEFWCGDELAAVTVIEDGQWQLRIDPRTDGRPWFIETSSLAAGIVEATRLVEAW